MKKITSAYIRAVFLLTAALSAFPAFAAKKEDIDYELLAREGSAVEIQEAFKKNSSLNTQVFGTERDTFLMLVLKNDRELDVVNICLNAECNVKAKSKSKKTPVMYAAECTSNPEVLEAVITSGTVLGLGVKGRITPKDAAGKTAFDYALLNKRCNTYQILSKYTQDPLAKETADAKTSEDKKETEQKASSTRAATSKTASSKPSKNSSKKTAGSDHGTIESSFTADAPAPDAETQSSQASAQSAPAKTAQAGTGTSVTDVTTTAPVTGTSDTAANTAAAATTQATSSESEDSIPRVSRSETNNSVTVPAVEITQTKAQPEPADPLSLIASSQTSSSSAAPKSASATQTTSAAPQTSGRAPVSAQSTGNSGRTRAPEIKQYSQTYLFDYVREDQEESTEEENTSYFRIDDPNQADSNGVTLLMKAAKAGNDWDVQNLLESGADVQLRDKDGWSALMYAVRYQNSIQLVNMLVEHGAHIRIRNKYNATPLLLASDYSQNPEIIALLLKNRSASEDEVFRAFIMSLTSNAGSDHVRMAKVQIFLDMGISVNRMWKGHTPLMYASQYSSSTAVIKQLLDNGAKTATTDEDGKTAFEYAKQNPKLPHDDTFWALNGGTR